MLENLKKLNYFKNIDSNLIKNLIDTRQIIQKNYHKGATVYEENTNCQGIDIIWSGKLIAYALAENGSQTNLFEFTKEDIIGANLLFGENNKYPMNIYSIQDSTTFYISESGTKELLKEYNFVIPFIRGLSANSQGMNQKIAIYTQKTLRENLKDYFLSLSIEQNSKSIILPITKKQIASHLGVQRPSLFRELKKMKDEGLIKIDNRHIEIYY